MHTSVGPLINQFTTTFLTYITLLSKIPFITILERNKKGQKQN
ncbi:hypothetical protein Leryth_022029 [Lithospermum erythrorhizon]|nr:hypothetical protein Leryth_022029 [Lithospermum erythrorhizon]